MKAQVLFVYQMLLLEILWFNFTSYRYRDRYCPDYRVLSVCSSWSWLSRITISFPFYHTRWHEIQYIYFARQWFLLLVPLLSFIVWSVPLFLSLEHPVMVQEDWILLRGWNLGLYTQINNSCWSQKTGLLHSLLETRCDARAIQGPSLLLPLLFPKAKSTYSCQASSEDKISHCHEEQREKEREKVEAEKGSTLKWPSVADCLARGPNSQHAGQGAYQFLLQFGQLEIVDSLVPLVEPELTRQTSSCSTKWPRNRARLTKLRLTQSCSVWSRGWRPSVLIVT